MSPKTVLVMRHADKPEDPTSPHLSDAGYERANRLVEFIPETFGKPDYIFAAAITTHSARSSETVAPLAQSIGKDVMLQFADTQFADLAAKLLEDSRYSDTLVLICWHHDHLPSMARALGAKPGDYPEPWDPEVFDQILCFRFSDDSELRVSKVIEPF